MHVKRKYGKSELEVNGTQEQVDRAVAAWREEIKSGEPMVELCDTIRADAVRIGMEGAKDLPVIEVYRRLRGLKVDV